MENKNALDWFDDELNKKASTSFKMKNSDESYIVLPINDYIDLYQQAKEKEREYIIDELINFQIYLNDKGLITNHDWDYEKVSKKYVKKFYGK